MYILAHQTNTNQMKIWSKRINFQAVLFSPFILAVLPAAILLALLPLNLPKYEATIVSAGKNGQGQSTLMTVYADLNGDEINEKFVLGSREDIDSSVYFVRVNSIDFKFKEEWVFKQKPVTKSYPGFYDFDHNGLLEAYFFTQKEDSLFINQLDPYLAPEYARRTFFVDLINSDRNVFDISMLLLDCADHDGDSLDELTFAACGGYCRQPRRLYRLHPRSELIEASENTAIGYDLMVANVITDLDGDGNNEYLLANSDVKNFSEIADQTTLPYLDTCAYVLAIDDDLQMLFEPIPLKTMTFKPELFFNKQKPLFYYCEKGESYLQNKVVIRNANGKLISSFPLFDTPERLFALPDFWRTESELLAITDGRSVYLYNRLGSLMRKIQIKEGTLSSSKAIKLLTGSTPQMVLICGNIIEILDHKLRYPVRIRLPDFSDLPVYISVIKNNKNSALFSINNRFSQFEVSYGYNSLYPWRHPIWFAVYLSVVLLLWLTQLLQKKQSQQKYEAERQLMAFRFRALKNQVDPHFTLNALNSIAQMQEQGQQERAGKFLVKFSRMIHRTLENSEKIETTLEEELDFVRDYLDVQQMRFRNAFSFEIKLEDEALSELLIPRHLIHTFVENAIKHGLRPLEVPGRLIINVYRERENVTIEVDDNGIGREEAANNKSLSTGKGLKILDELITLFEKLRKSQISYEIIDKKDEQGKPTGTKVLIKIPDHEL